jgi:hypothetical protein
VHGNGKAATAIRGAPRVALRSRNPPGLSIPSLSVRIGSEAGCPAALFETWAGRDGNDPSVDIAKDADQRF